MKILILDDGKIGHLNQSIAFAKYLGGEYDTITLTPRYRWSKAITYILDKLKIETARLFADISLKNSSYDFVVGTGSLTYYMVKVLAEQLQAKSVVMMLPKGYSIGYDMVFAQSHDTPPKEKNIIEVPANFAYVEPQGMYRAKKKAIGIVIGGDNKIFKMSAKVLKKQLDFIKEYYAGYEFAITTSPRTSVEIEKLIESYHFDYEVIFSKNAVNPIADFLKECESVLITGDSTSMISESISYGKANIVVLPLIDKGKNKFTYFIESLEEGGYLHIFNGTIQQKNRKIDFTQYIEKII